ncbi:NAD(P)-dependent alcohol dehydrogenase [Mesobacillus maritimus]|uniref:NAD(P)-dependent alcohol dehydrogenase n=1 Tax=Mesobacillus maritimus TaxID=1643336 RepID=A0ABS7K0H3_9BACI|nr:NAD(P)-dependent alcohol dehydrogenase [Mesobacillus maritimus]MBY0095670.1 NAD(P)-dependent alcohol dehydrogenase [Mesobacillus maritimus]
MKAIISNQYGSPETLDYLDVNKPILEDHQVLVKVHAVSVNYGNLVLLRGKPYLARLAFGVVKPKYKIPGGDIAGVVESVGKNVSQFQPGDEVYGDLSSSGWGGFAEYVAVPELAIAHKPTNLSFVEAAAVPMAAVTALQGLRDKGKVKAGQQVLIYGGSGGVGTFAVQIAKALGAEVTTVCSTSKVDIAKTIGADTVFDYTKEDFSQRKERYDVIIGANGYQPIATYKQALKEKGTFVHVGGSETQMYQVMLKGPWINLKEKKKMGNFLQKANQKDLVFMKELIEEGKVKPVIDRQYQGLGEIPEALNYFEGGHAAGKVVVSVVQS